MGGSCQNGLRLTFRLGISFAFEKFHEFLSMVALDDDSAIFCGTSHTAFLLQQFAECLQVIR